MHIPDGILPVRIWLLGFLIMSLVMAVSLLLLRNRDLKKKIPLLGAVSAAMLVAMSLEIVPLSYHINLSVVAGILLGPALGFLAAFITNLMLALIGHGGITVIGLNTLLLGTEAILGHTLFYLLYKPLPVFWRAIASTVLTLFITTMLLIGVVASSHLDPELFAHEDHGAEQGTLHEGHISVERFAAMTLTLGVFGWIIEAAITGAVVTFIARVKPDLLGHVLHREKSAKDGGAPQ
ncbi:MAG: energy-coupling factor ABC transporter permease [Betaproteobacteria bacterium]